MHWVEGVPFLEVASACVVRTVFVDLSVDLRTHIRIVSLFSLTPRNLFIPFQSHFN